MKIILSPHRFLPHFVGGVETYTLHLAHAFQGAGHEVHILTGEPIPRKNLAVEIQEDVYEGVPVTRLVYDYLRRPVAERASYSDPLVTAQIKAALQKLQPDLVHATSLSLLMAGMIEATSTLNIPLVYTATDFVLTCRRGTYLKRDESICVEQEEVALCTACMGPYTRFEKLLNQIWELTPKGLAQPFLPLAEAIVGKRADFVYASSSIQYRLNYLSKWMPKIERIIAPSTHMRDTLVLNGFPAERITISAYGVQPPKANFSKTTSMKLRFGFIGRVTSIKGTHLLIEAFKQLPRQEKAQLTIYGKADVKSGQYMRMLQHQAANQSNITFAGFVNNADIAKIYRQLDVLVVPSIWPENSPVTILEALAHGIPVITSDVRGIADLVQHEVNGLIFANQNVQDLGMQMARCQDSPDLVSRLASQCRLIKSLAEDANDIIQLYEEIVAKKSSQYVV